MWRLVLVSDFAGYKQLWQDAKFEITNLKKKLADSKTTADTYYRKNWHIEKDLLEFRKALEDVAKYKAKYEEAAMHVKNLTVVIDAELSKARWEGQCTLY